MKTMLLYLMLNPYVSGTAPFCIVTDFGDADCFYYSLSSCQQAVQWRTNAFCAYNPNGR